jgi:hypothetical protein
MKQRPNRPFAIDYSAAAIASGDASSEARGDPRQYRLGQELRGVVDLGTCTRPQIRKHHRVRHAASTPLANPPACGDGQRQYYCACSRSQAPGVSPLENALFLPLAPEPGRDALIDLDRSDQNALTRRHDLQLMRSSKTRP